MSATHGLAVRYGHATHVGHRRELNEDSYLASFPLFIVADGMGGYAGGETASRIVADAFAASPLNGAVFPEVTVPEADLLLKYAADRITHEVPGAATTATGALLITHEGQPHWMILNVGDSRTYLHREGIFGQVTTDHSLVQAMVEAGQITPQEAFTHPRRHAVTRALGRGLDPAADYVLMPALAGDRVLVCSDGLSGEVAAETLEALAASGSPQDACDELVEAALQAGGADNITVIVVDIDPAE